MRHSECELAHRAIRVFRFKVVEYVVFGGLRVGRFELLSKICDKTGDCDDGHNNVYCVGSGRVKLRDKPAVGSSRCIIGLLFFGTDFVDSINNK